MRSKTTYILLTLMAGILMLTACRRTPVEAVQLHRFEKVLFEGSTEQMPQRLASSREEFATPLLNIAPENPEFMAMLAGFVADPTMRDIYHIVDSVFGDMNEESALLGKALARAKDLDPDLNYDKVYTYISGSFDYNMRVGFSDHELLISLDQYVLPHTERYGFFGTPMYLVKQSRREYLPVDCMIGVASEHICVAEDRTMTLLDYMIAEGKAIYFAQQVLPEAPDSLLMRYTSEQINWMEHNEENVWTYFMQNQLLYETDYMRFHNFIDDAPSTNAFRDSAPRTTDYIGWHIVSQYMKRNNCSLQELFKETDAQKILSQSNYRP